MRLQQNIKKNSIQILGHIGLWAIILIFPTYFTTKTMYDFHPNKEHFSILPLLVMNAFLVAIFYLNYYVFVPKFLLKRKYMLYGLICVGLFFVLRELPHQMMRIVRDFELHHIPPPRLDDNARKIFPILLSNSFLTFILIFMSSIALRINSRLKTTEREKYTAQLAYLKTQINPHFLFNILNSIYSSTLSTTPQAAEMIEKLSEMMRYTLKEAQEDYIPLEKELSNIENYISLQKIRFGEMVDIEYHLEGTVGTEKIAPLLLLPFIENAFKHGVNAEENSRIKIDIILGEKALTLKVENNKVFSDNATEDKSGLGIDNTRKRLELIYPTTHQLNIKETDNQFIVVLKIKLK